MAKASGLVMVRTDSANPESIAIDVTKFWLREACLIFCESLSGKKRAIVAVAHHILVIGCHLIQRDGHYRELGPDYLDRFHQARLERYLNRRLESLGYTVILRPAET